MTFHPNFPQLPMTSRDFQKTRNLLPGIGLWQSHVALLCPLLPPCNALRVSWRFPGLEALACQHLSTSLLYFFLDNESTYPHPNPQRTWASTMSGNIEKEKKQLQKAVIL